MRSLTEIMAKNLGNGTELKPYSLQERADRFNRKRGDLTDYDCPICKNKGVVMRISGEIETMMECECMSVRRSAKLIRKSGLSSMIDQKHFENYIASTSWQQIARETAQAYAYQPDGWLMLCGQSGTGKTHLCTAVAGELLKKGVPTLYMLWRSDSVRLKACISDDTAYQRMIYPLKTIQCLYIDDLFKGKVSDADINLAFELLDHRYRMDLQTIISTEKSPEELEQIDVAIAGRIVEKCDSNIAWIMKDKEKNYRYRNRGESNDVLHTGQATGKGESQDVL